MDYKKILLSLILLTSITPNAQASEYIKTIASWLCGQKNSHVRPDESSKKISPSIRQAITTKTKSVKLKDHHEHLVHSYFSEEWDNTLDGKGKQYCQKLNVPYEQISDSLSDNIHFHRAYSNLNDYDENQAQFALILHFLPHLVHRDTYNNPQKYISRYHFLNRSAHFISALSGKEQKIYFPTCDSHRASILNSVKKREENARIKIKNARKGLTVKKTKTI